MSAALSIENLRRQLTSLRDEASQFFSEVGKADEIRRQPIRKVGQTEGGESFEFGDYRPGEHDINGVAHRLSVEERLASEALVRELKRLMVGVASFVKGAALLGEADVRDLGDLTKEMAAALKFRRYRHWGIYIHHDEGDYIGADPPGQSEDETVSVKEAHSTFINSHKRVMEMTDLVSDSDRGFSAPAGQGSSSYRPDTAFIMMQIDKTKPELVDVLDAVRDVFLKFGIKARRSDEIQHDDSITAMVLDEIASSEFLFADLTGSVRMSITRLAMHTQSRNV